MYYDDTLIKLRRQYSKDETVAALNKKLSEVEVQKGQMQAEIDHLNSTITNLRNENAKSKETQILKDNPIWIQQREVVKKRGEQIRTLRKDNQILITEIIKLRSQLTSDNN